MHLKQCILKQNRIIHLIRCSKTKKSIMKKACVFLEKKLSFINKNKIVNSFSLAWTSLICLLGLISIISVSFFTNFDISDEGYHLYYHIFGPSQTSSMIGMHFFTHPIGSLFNHSVLGYRFMTLISMLLLSIFLTYSIKKYHNLNNELTYQESMIFYSVICITSLSFFVWIPSFEYNAFSVYSAIGWASSLFCYFHYKTISRKLSLIFLFLISFSIFIAILTKFTFGITLYVSNILTLILYFHLFNKKIIKEILLINLSLFILLILVYILYPNYWERFFRICNFIFYNNAYGGKYDIKGTFYLIETYTIQIITFFKQIAVFMFGMSTLYIFRKKNIHFKNIDILLKILIISFISFLAIHSIPPFDSKKPFTMSSISALRILYAALLSTSFFYLIELKKYQEIKKIGFSCIVLMVILLHPTGTTNNFISSSSIGLIGLGSLFTILLLYITKNFTKQKAYILAIIISLTTVIGYSVTRSQILYYYRNAPYSQQNSYSKYSPYLKKIKIEKKLSYLIDSLWQTLSKINFDRKKDKIFAYSDLPGFLSSLGIRSFGESWAITGYPNSYHRMCLHFDFEPIGYVRYIYILKRNNSPLHPIIKDCLFKK